MTREEVIAISNIDFTSNPAIFKDAYHPYQSCATVNEYLSQQQEAINELPKNLTKADIKIIDKQSAMWKFASQFAGGQKWIYAASFFNIAGSELNIIITTPTEEVKQAAIQCYRYGNGLSEYEINLKSDVTPIDKDIWRFVTTPDGRTFRRDDTYCSDADMLSRPWMQIFTFEGAKWVANLTNGKASPVSEDVTTRDEREMRKRVGEMIWRLRNNKKLSIRELAELADVTPANLSRIENGKYNAGIDIISRICTALGATLRIE